MPEVLRNLGFGAHTGAPPMGFGGRLGRGGRIAGVELVSAVGVDVIEIDRVEATLAKFGARFLGRVYTKLEVAACRGRVNELAVRFAAKEAVMKALGRGWGSKVRWLDIEVGRARSGKPEIVLHDKTAQLAEQLGIRRWALSITHTKEHGLAYVIAEGGKF